MIGAGIATAATEAGTGEARGITEAGELHSWSSSSLVGSSESNDPRSTGWSWSASSWSIRSSIFIPTMILPSPRRIVTISGKSSELQKSVNLSSLLIERR